MKFSRIAATVLVVGLVVVVGLRAFASSPVGATAPGVVNDPQFQDSQGNTARVHLDDGGNLPVYVNNPVQATNCVTPTYSIVILSNTAASPVPATALSTRVLLEVTNSPENTGSPLIKCRSDGIAPTMGIESAHPEGDVFGVGQGKPYALLNNQVLNCISDTNGTAILALECAD